MLTLDWSSNAVEFCFISNTCNHLAQILFSTKTGPLANEAVDIWEAIKTAVKSNKGELTEMEQAVIDQKSGKKKKFLSQAVSEASSNKPMTTAHVVLDGIQTQVNLGTNLSF